MTEPRSSLADLTGAPIDPVAALRRLQANGDLDGPQATMLRVLWVRADHPDTRVETELTHLHDDLIVFRALVALPGGATATGYASETGVPGKNMAIAIERAETRAIGRALDVLGYVIASAAATRNNGDTHAPSVVDALRKASLHRSPTGTVVLPDLVPDPDIDESIDPEPDVIAGSTGAPETAGPSVPTAPVTPVPAAPQPMRRPATEPAVDPPLEDYTWTHFWRWARGHNLTTKGQVEQRIGRPLDNLTPADVRVALQATGIEL